MVMLMLGGAHHRPHQGLHHVLGLLLHEGDDPLFGIQRAQRAADDGLDDLLGIQRSSDRAGKIVENRQFLNGPAQTLVFILQRTQRVFGLALLDHDVVRF